jgi:hypothetical protein
MMGAGKYSPDETQVSQQQSLSMPPDLQLRPPSNTAEAAAQEQTASLPPQQVPAAPQGYEQPATAEAQETYSEPVQQQAYNPPPQQTNTQPQQPPQDVYVRLGISKTRPDGTPKSQGELNEELRQIKIARERQKNPNYGTIWNLGDVWRENQQ